VEGTSFGNYRLLTLLGRGGMGEVWRAVDTASSREVALKVLQEHSADDRTYRARFLREAQAVAAISDPHVIPIHAYGDIDDRLYVDMKLVEGRDLQDVISEGPLSVVRAVAIVEQVASALTAAHTAGLTHRDVKPSNVLIDSTDFAYLIDFGIAHAADATRMTSVGSTIGTWAYMAPERFSSDDVDPRSDVYALACVLYECLTGTTPFAGERFERQYAGHMSETPPKPSVHNSSVPTALDKVIAKGMAKKPEKRYRSATDLAQAARVAVASTAVAPTAPTAHAVVPDTSKSRWLTLRGLQWWWLPFPLLLILFFVLMMIGLGDHSGVDVRIGPVEAPIAPSAEVVPGKYYPSSSP
jgi:serine/threonine protein kinase